MEKNELKIVFVISSTDNYYGEPVAFKVVDTEEKAIEIVKKIKNTEYEEFEVE